MSLKKSAVIMIAGNGVYAACQWGVIVVLARLGGAAEVGLFALALAITAPLFIFFNLALRQSIASDVAGKYKFQDYLTLRVLGQLFAFALAVIIALTFADDRAFVLTLFAVALSKAVEGVSDIYYGYFQQNENYRQIALSRIVRGVTGLGLFAFALYLGASTHQALATMAVSWVVVACICDVRSGPAFSFVALVRKTGTKQQWQKIFKPLVWLMLPMALGALLGSLRTNIPRYFLEFFTDVETLGRYAALAYLLVAANIVIAAIGQTTMPRLARYWHERSFSAYYSLLVKKFFLYVALAVAGIVIVWFLGEPITRLIYGEQFASDNQLFVAIVFAAGVSYFASLVGIAVEAARLFRSRFIMEVSSSVACLIASYFLIAQIGGVGAALALAISLAVQTLVGLVIIFKTQRELTHRVVANDL